MFSTRLMTTRGAFALLVILLLSTGTAWSQTTIEVTRLERLTINPSYDRNPSVTFDGSEYWLF